MRPMARDMLAAQALWKYFKFSHNANQRFSIHAVETAIHERKAFNSRPIGQFTLTGLLRNREMFRVAKREIRPRRQFGFINTLPTVEFSPFNRWCVDF